MRSQLLRAGLSERVHVALGPRPSAASRRRRTLPRLALRPADRRCTSGAVAHTQARVRGSPVPCISLCPWCLTMASPANVHRNKAPSRTSPDLTPACAPIVPTTATAPTPTRATPSDGVVPTTAPTRVTPSGGISKTKTNANTGSRHSWTTPTPATAAPCHPRATSAPTGTVPSSTAPSSSSEPAVDAGAMKAAAAEPRPRRGVGRNQRRTQS
jgi:hypothetical protein